MDMGERTAESSSEDEAGAEAEHRGEGGEASGAEVDLRPHAVNGPTESDLDDMWGANDEGGEQSGYDAAVAGLDDFIANIDKHQGEGSEASAAEVVLHGLDDFMTDDDDMDMGERTAESSSEDEAGAGAEADTEADTEAEAGARGADVDMDEFHRLRDLFHLEQDMEAAFDDISDDDADADDAMGDEIPPEERLARKKAKRWTASEVVNMLKDGSAQSNLKSMILRYVAPGDGEEDDRHIAWKQHIRIALDTFGRHCQEAAVYGDETSTSKSLREYIRIVLDKVVFKTHLDRCPRSRDRLVVLITRDYVGTIDENGIPLPRYDRAMVQTVRRCMNDHGTGQTRLLVVQVYGPGSVTTNPYGRDEIPMSLNSASTLLACCAQPVVFEPDDMWVRPLRGISLYTQFLATFPLDGESPGDTSLYARRIERGKNNALGIQLTIENNRATVYTDEHDGIPKGSTVVAIQGRRVGNVNKEDIKAILDDTAIAARKTLVLVFRKPSAASDDESTPPDYSESVSLGQGGYTIEDIHEMLSVVMDSVRRSKSASRESNGQKPWQRFRQEIKATGMAQACEFAMLTALQHRGKGYTTRVAVRAAQPHCVLPMASHTVFLPLPTVLTLLQQAGRIDKSDIPKFMAKLLPLIPNDLGGRASLQGIGRRIGHMRDIMSLAYKDLPMTIYIPGDEVASYYNRETVRLAQIKKKFDETNDDGDLNQMNPLSVYNNRPWQQFRELCCTASLCQTLIAPVLLPDAYTQDHESGVYADDGFQPLQDAVLAGQMMHQREWYTQRPRLRPREAGAVPRGAPSGPRRSPDAQRDDIDDFLDILDE